MISINNLVLVQRTINVRISNFEVTQPPGHQRTSDKTLFIHPRRLLVVLTRDPSIQQHFELLLLVTMYFRVSQTLSFCYPDVTTPIYFFTWTDTLIFKEYL